MKHAAKQASRSQKVWVALGKIQSEVGYRNEQSVIDAFEKARSEGKLPDWLHTWELQERHSEKDRAGIDIIFNTDINNLYVQVKSSNRGAENFRKDHSKGGPRIIVVVIKIWHNLEKIKDYVLNELAKERNYILSLRAARS